jgi:hypothetical protein
VESSGGRRMQGQGKRQRSSEHTRRVVRHVGLTAQRVLWQVYVMVLVRSSRIQAKKYQKFLVANSGK